MDIERGAARLMMQWRQFVHPLPVILIVVGGRGLGLPASGAERQLRDRQARKRKQDIDIRNHARLRRPQPARQIGRAFEQN